MARCTNDPETVSMTWRPVNHVEQSSSVFHAKALNDTRWYFRRNVNEQNIPSFYLYRAKDGGPQTVTIDFTVSTKKYSSSIIFSSQYSFATNSYKEIKNMRTLYASGSSIECRMRLSDPNTLPRLHLLANDLVWNVRNNWIVPVDVLNTEEWEIDFTIPLPESFLGASALLVTMKKDFLIRVEALDGTPDETICVLGTVSQDLNGFETKPGIVFYKLGPQTALSSLQVREYTSTCGNRGLFKEDVSLIYEFYVAKYSDLSYLISETASGDDFISFKSENLSPQVDKSSKDVNLLEALADDLGSIYEERTFTDINLKVKDQTFPAHKAILCARSPVFRVMLDTAMLEKKRNEVTIPDLDAPTVDAMLTYMYTGKLDLQLECAVKLYYAGDKYQIASLKDACSDFLKSRLSTSNACQVLILSDMHQDEDLKFVVQDFICSRNTEMFASDSWKNFLIMKPQLAAETMQVFFQKM